MRWALAAGLLAALGTGCAASGSRQATEPGPAPGEQPAHPAATEPVQPWIANPKALFEALEHLRDRPFQRRPALLPRPSLGSPLEPPDSTSLRDRHIIATALMGLSPAEVAQLDAAIGLGALARYDAKEHAILYHAPAAGSGEMRVALALAAAQALDAELPGRVRGEPESWDEGLALEASRLSTAAMAAALALHPASAPGDVPASPSGAAARQLAERPEMALALESLRPWLEPEPGASPDQAAFLARGLAAWPLREGLALAAALYRAGGWSGAEAIQAMPARHSADVVRPDRWMSGEGPGVWQWPAELAETRFRTGWQLQRQGHVGPALLSLWLSKELPAKAARTVYAGWRADAFRYYGREGAPADMPGPWLMEWVSQWDTPSSAAEVAQALAQALQARSPEAGDKDAPQVARHAVAHQGLTVAVVVLANPQERTALQASARRLSEASVSYPGREPLGLGFVPSRLDQFVARAQEARREGALWRDPASGVALDLGPVDGPGWTLQMARETRVRWFARHGDGALAQLTTELIDPFGPAFPSQAWGERLVQAFEATLPGAQVASRAFVPPTPERPGAWHLALKGMLGEKPVAMELWQFAMDDVVVTLSVQCDPAEALERASAVREVWQSLRALEAPAKPWAPAPAQDEGILRFEVEP